MSLSDAPLKIHVTVVRRKWLGVFGMEFRYVEATIRERLAQYLSTLHPVEWTLMPFAQVIMGIDSTLHNYRLRVTDHGSN